MKSRVWVLLGVLGWLAVACSDDPQQTGEEASALPVDAGSSADDASDMVSDTSTDNTTEDEVGVTADIGHEDTTVDAHDGSQVSFYEDIVPIFEVHCGDCHNAESSLPLTIELAAHNLFENEPRYNCTDSEGQIIEQPYVVPGAPEESFLWIKVSRSEVDTSDGWCGREMPPSARLLVSAPDEAELIRLWIEQGAHVD